jgi:hypothetical protein
MVPFQLYLTALSGAITFSWLPDNRRGKKNLLYTDYAEKTDLRGIFKAFSL